MFKNMARKPISKIKTNLKYGFVIQKHEYLHCPRCKSILNAGENYQPKYCDQCGQKITFKGIKWKMDKVLGYLQQQGMNQETHIEEETK